MCAKGVTSNASIKHFLSLVFNSPALRVAGVLKSIPAGLRRLGVAQATSRQFITGLIQDNTDTGSHTFDSKSFLVLSRGEVSETKTFLL